MGEKTGILWTDSTFNSVWGCTKVSVACDHCYAEMVDKRAPDKATGDLHWGAGAPRRLLSENARNEPYRWQKKADAFFAEHGRNRRAFTESMGDLFDNEWKDEWRSQHFSTMEACDRIEWQILTKRIPNVPKMVPDAWKMKWPEHIGLMITVVTQAEANRDVPRLLRMKTEFQIPWVGISFEPAMENIDWLYPKEIYPDGPPMCCSGFECGCYGQPTEPPLIYGLDWIVYGGESGAGWRTFDGFFDAARATRDACSSWNVAFFMKQCAAFRPTDDMIPADLMIRQWPKGH